MYVMSICYYLGLDLVHDILLSLLMDETQLLFQLQTRNLEMLVLIHMFTVKYYI